MPPLPSFAEIPVHEPPPRSGQFAIPTFELARTPANDDRLPEPSEVRALLGETMPALQRRARYLARSSAEADDLVNDTVERALRFSSSYQSGTNLRAWLMQIMYTVFASRCRKAQRERCARERLRVDPNAWSARAPEVADGRTVLKGLVDKLQALPEHYAEVLWLVDCQDYAYSEAADELGVPLGTVMSRLHRARRLLRSELDPQMCIS